MNGCALDLTTSTMGMVAAASLISTPSSIPLPKSISVSSFKNIFSTKTAGIIHCQKQQPAAGISDGVTVTKRNLLSICLTSSFLFSAGFRNDANAAILEADDDLELLEKVKKDRQKRIDRQLLLDSSKKETAYLQDAVYKLSKVGEAIDKEDLGAASSVLGSSTDAEWVQKANLAFIKLSSDPEEKTQVETFNSSLAKLISSVSQSDVQSSKQAFVASATALETWVSLAGLVSQFKGL